ncbi:TFIIE alpha subunit family protein [Metarhizium robertsii]|uniref:Transcription factor TFIIE, alpha subunit n=2 Tax=Metarhizium robertsii TaxID=568076 RepID=E9FAE7_METRA|nr:Transcription factor TFIIE, alpha subunit [Metarhizium robertsii ARSEF 23]EFY95297.2 Transcription factor TFIIE, alpha subunit [Metarhizium robertsii ARSEF 23]EXU95742.1 TFIIE alpha subunit family protein [Metarhizium robertsii]
MDLAVTLIRSVMRAFYPTRDILVMDALILHDALRDDDLAYLMAINTKDLHKICGKLREDGFLTVHTRLEQREGNSRSSNRTWYYINYRHTIDAIKWRLYTIINEPQGSPIHANEKKEYYCNFCKARWTTMEILDSVGASGFLCHRCNHTLICEADRTSTGHEQSTRLNDQFQFISELLPKIDSLHIPEYDFNTALSKARPVIRDATHQRAAIIPIDGDLNRPMAVKGLTNTGPKTITVNVSTSDDTSVAEREAKKARITHQNALPSWMSYSTVTGESFSGTSGAGISAANQGKVNKAAMPNTLADMSTSVEIDDYFEKLKAEQAAIMAQRSMQNDEDKDCVLDEQGDNDDSEDVQAIGKNSNVDVSGNIVPNAKELGGMSWDDSFDERASRRLKKAKPDIRGAKSTSREGSYDDDEIEFEDI